ncbi:unnamed protein product [Coffea canephora]|uniref:Uncharacterized protein n=1 Tax=Coffea canephora TaxID=49390 RepID=A0A068TN70_COFCA|nr:unnamed protein product [Coffea canephora]
MIYIYIFFFFFFLRKYFSKKKEKRKRGSAGDVTRGCMYFPIIYSSKKKGKRRKGKSTKILAAHHFTSCSYQYIYVQLFWLDFDNPIAYWWDV